MPCPFPPGKCIGVCAKPKPIEKCSCEESAHLRLALGLIQRLAASAAEEGWSELDFKLIEGIATDALKLLPLKPATLDFQSPNRIRAARGVLPK